MSIRLLPAQIRGARGMLSWSMVDLARAAGISVSTVKRMEMAEAQPVSGEVHTFVQAAFENVGLHFLDDLGDGIGLRLQLSGARPPVRDGAEAAHVGRPSRRGG